MIHEHLLSVLDYDPRTGVFKWRVSRGTRTEGSVAGHLDAYGYRVINIDKRQYKAHRLAWFYVYREWPARHLDHANLDKDDNRIINLREATHSQQKANTPVRRDSSIGVKGVTRRNKRFAAYIMKEGKRRCVGCFATVEEAHAAYLEAAQRLFGEFARSC